MPDVRNSSHRNNNLRLLQDTLEWGIWDGFLLKADRLRRAWHHPWSTKIRSIRLIKKKPHTQNFPRQWWERPSKTQSAFCCFKHISIYKSDSAKYAHDLHRRSSRGDRGFWGGDRTTVRGMLTQQSNSTNPQLPSAGRGSNPLIIYRHCTCQMEWAWQKHKQ